MLTAHPSPLGLASSFGFGDRLGCATAGHLEALRRHGGDIRGIFAQQSIREMTRTRRSPEQVMADAANALAAESFDGPWGADADHLKTPQDVDATVAAGFTFFTIDPSEHVDQAADGYDSATLDAKFEQVRDQIGWLDDYRGKTVAIEGGPVLRFEEQALRRAAVKYGRAIGFAINLGRYIAAAIARPHRPPVAIGFEGFMAAVAADAAAQRHHEIELSVDETEQPTTLVEHYIIADQCLRAGMKLVSLAPRFIGDLEKGVDYKGDLKALERSLRDHAAIARQLGPYKLSLHSGSDKLSMYGLFARATEGRFHVKTAGTSYLEALRVAARHDPALFRRIIDFARARYDRDRATYHVSAKVTEVPAPAEVADGRALEALYLQHWEDVPPGQGFTNPGRQILHCTFGSVLTDPDLAPRLHQLLAAHPATYREVLADHFGRHLQALREG